MKLFAEEGKVTYMMDNGTAIVMNTVNEEQAHALLDGKPVKESKRFPEFNLEVSAPFGGKFYVKGEIEKEAAPVKEKAEKAPETTTRKGRGKKANG